MLTQIDSELTIGDQDWLALLPQATTSNTHDDFFGVRSKRSQKYRCNRKRNESFSTVFADSWRSC